MSLLKEARDALDRLLNKNIDDEECLKMINGFIKENLKQKITEYKIEKTTLMERLLKKQDYIYEFLHDKEWQYYSVYNEKLDTNVFIKYDGRCYDYISQDDISHKVIQELNPPSILSSMKRDIAEEIILLIEGKSLFEALPESFTIQNIIEFFCPTFFETKEELKYFFAVVGDCILNKKEEIVYYIPELSRGFINVINLFYKDYFGKDVDLSRFKFKYRGHDYEHSRIIQIKKTIGSMSFINEYIKKNIFNILVISCHYSARYQNAEKYMEKQNEKLQRKIFYLKIRNKDKIVQEFLQTKTKTFIDSTISQNDMYFLWKLFCDSKDLPMIMYKSNFIECLNKNITCINNIYQNVTSEYLNPARNLQKFWEKSITIDTQNIISDEYEISELCELYNIWLKSEADTTTVINEKDMKELILYFYPKIEVKNKCIYNIYCSYWNKQKDMREAIKAKFDKKIADNITLLEAYLSYASYSDKNEKINIASKKYFEKYIGTIIPEKYLKNKVILKEYWETF